MPRTKTRSSGKGASSKSDAVPPGLERHVAATAEGLAALVAEAAKQIPDAVAADHTATADKPDRKPRRTRRSIGQLLAQMERRNRKQLMPHYAAGALVGLTHAIHDMAAQADALGAAAVVTALAAGVSGVIGHLLLRRRQQLLEQWAMWSTMLSTATAIWMVVAVSTGVTLTTLAAALAVDYAFGARWWSHHRHPEPLPRTPEPVMPAIDLDPTQLALYARRWADYVGCTGGVLAGSSLVDGQFFANGVEYLLRLVPGKQDIDSVRAVIGKVASGLGVPQTKLIVEQHDSEHPALLTLRVVTASPVQSDVYFRTPEHDKGNILLGPYADGIGMAKWRLYSEDSMWGGMVIGGTGSGKSRLLEVIGLCALDRGDTYVIHVDGQDGASCPALWEHAHERYGSDQVDEVLVRLAAIQKERQRNRPRGVTGFTPSRAMPGVLVIVDEAHVLITKETVDAWAKLAREARKIGLGIVMGDQDGSLETFKKAVLRSSLKAGNCVGLRTDDRVQGSIVSNGKFNLVDLPRIAGFGYTLGDKARFAPFRGKWLPSRSNAAERAADGCPLPPDLLLVEDWYEHVEKFPLDHASKQAAEDAVVEWRRKTKSPSRPAGPGGPSRPGGTAGPGRVLPFSRRDSAPNLAPFPSAQPPAGRPTGGGLPPVPSAQAPVAASTSPAHEQHLTETQRAVIDCIARDITQPGAIAAELKVTRQHVGNTLAPLLEQGYVTKTGNGPAVRYAIAQLTA